MNHGRPAVELYPLHDGEACVELSGCSTGVLLVVHDEGDQIAVFLTVEELEKIRVEGQRLHGEHAAKMRRRALARWLLAPVYRLHGKIASREVVEYHRGGQLGPGRTLRAVRLVMDLAEMGSMYGARGVADVARDRIKRRKL